MLALAKARRHAFRSVAPSGIANAILFLINVGADYTHLLGGGSPGPQRGQRIFLLFTQSSFHIPTKNQGVAIPNAPLWVHHVDVDSIDHNLMDG